MLPSSLKAISKAYNTKIDRIFAIEEELSRVDALKEELKTLRAEAIRLDLLRNIIFKNGRKEREG